MSEEISIVPDIGLAKALFSSNSTNNYSAANTGSRSVNGVSSMKYATVHEDTTGNGKVKIILDGSTEVIEVDSAETFKKGDRVCVLYMGGSYKAFSLMGGTIGGNMVVFDGIFANKIIANEAFIRNLTAANAFIDNLTANKAFINSLIANNAFIEQLTANKAFVDDLEAKYVTVSKSNIDQAWINDLFVKSQFVAQEGTVFNLTGLHIDANDITSGTLTVDRLVVQGSDGEYYLLEPDGTGSFDQTKLNGNIIKQNSLHADRITANSITTEQITTNNLVGTGGWINLAQGTFAYGNPKTDSNGKYLGNFISWDGSKLKLNVDDLSVDSTSFSDTLQTLRTSITQNADNITIAASKANSASATANAVDSKLDDLLTTNFIFDSTGLSIKSSNASYYTKITSTGFNILKTSNDIGFTMNVNTNKYCDLKTTTSGYCIGIQPAGTSYRLNFGTGTMEFNRGTDTGFVVKRNGHTGSYEAWERIWNGNTTGSLTFSYPILSAGHLVILFQTGEQSGDIGCDAAIYDMMYGNGYVLLSGNHLHAGGGVAMTTKLLRVTTNGLTVSKGGRGHIATNGIANANVSNTATISIRAVYYLCP